VRNIPEKEIEGGFQKSKTETTQRRDAKLKSVGVFVPKTTINYFLII
jgi:hypothetical protein